MSDKYVINADNTVVRMDDLVEWSSRFETDERRIARTTMYDGRIVSTVFLGINHNFGPSGAPLVFETMIFPSEKDFSEEWCERCSTFQQAVSQHRRGISEAQRLARVSNSDTPAAGFRSETQWYR